MAQQFCNAKGKNPMNLKVHRKRLFQLMIVGLGLYGGMWLNQNYEASLEHLMKENDKYSIYKIMFLNRMPQLKKKTG